MLSKITLTVGFSVGVIMLRSDGVAGFLFDFGKKLILPFVSKIAVSMSLILKYPGCSALC